ncbi:MAG: 6-phosphogluconolactonase [Sphingomonadaceae bacterium]|nr:6-phosphogluconolactonase [Sphingomonadaceae bacterium]
MIEAEWWEYDEADEAADAIASDIEFILDSALDARGEALVALPGGAAAAPVYARLAKAKLAWKRVTILPTDDRLVAPTDPASVVGLLAKTFLPIGARVIPLVGDIKAGHRAAGLAADERLGAMKWPLDLAWLIVEGDGSTGSLVASPDLDAAMTAPAKAIGVGTADGGRVTLTRATLMAARTVLVAAQGAEARDVIEAAVEEGTKAGTPIARLLAGTELPIDIHWTA